MLERKYRRPGVGEEVQGARGWRGSIGGQGLERK